MARAHPPDGGKVFCIGFHKTGTSSLYNALKLLGYRVAVTDRGLTTDSDIASNALPKVSARMDEADAFCGNPWAVLYKEIDALRPDSKFILTVRPPDLWIESARKYFGEASTPMREWIYGAGRGSPRGNEQIYLDRYNRHNAEVVEYFSGRPESLLVIGLTVGDGWGPLCRFLGRDIPDAPFPSVRPQQRHTTT